MSDEAFEMLARIRGWACRHLTPSEAGSICGLLSDVACHVGKVEKERDRLQGHLVTLMQGMNTVLCSDYDGWRCEKECPMYADESECEWTRAYDTLREMGTEVNYE